MAFVCELKIDGVAMSLTYDKGQYVQAAVLRNHPIRGPPSFLV